MNTRNNKKFGKLLKRIRRDGSLAKTLKFEVVLPNGKKSSFVPDDMAMITKRRVVSKADGSHWEDANLQSQAARAKVRYLPFMNVRQNSLRHFG